jgi:hypothetical protein
MKKTDKHLKTKNQKLKRRKEVDAKKTSASHKLLDSRKTPVGRRFEKGYIVETPD